MPVAPQSSAFGVKIKKRISSLFRSFHICSSILTNNSPKNNLRPEIFFEFINNRYVWRPLWKASGKNENGGHAKIYIQWKSRKMKSLQLIYIKYLCTINLSLYIRIWSIMYIQIVEEKRGTWADEKIQQQKNDFAPGCSLQLTLI